MTSHVLHAALLTTLYAGRQCSAAAEACLDTWCPPPLFPDLLAAFAESLGLSPAMRNLSAQLILSGTPLSPSPPCRLLADCCLTEDADGPPLSRPCPVSTHAAAVDLDLSPSTSSCRRLFHSSGGSRDLVASGRNRPVQYSRSLEDKAIDADWSDSLPIIPDEAVLRGSLQRPTVTTAADRDETDDSGQSAAAAASDASLPLWSSVRGRLLIVAVTVSMLASIIILVVWICLRRRLSKYDAAPDTEQEAICMYERVLADHTRSRDRRLVDGGSDVISDERTLIGPTPPRRYV